MTDKTLMHLNLTYNIPLPFGVKRINTDWLAKRCVIEMEDGRAMLIPIDDRWTVGYYDVINGPVPPPGKRHGDTYEKLNYKRMEDELLVNVRQALDKLDISCLICLQ